MSLTTDQLLERHQSTLADHKPIPYLSELMAVGKFPRVLIITCADPRCIPENFFKLQTGEVAVIRNAGGNAQYALNHVLSIDSLIHFSEVMVVQHTDCGATHFRDATIKEGLKQRAPDMQAEIEGMTFGEITGTLEANVAKSMHFLKESPLVPDALKQGVRGFVYDIKTGDLNEVVA